MSSTPYRCIAVRSAAEQYDIHIGPGVLAHVGEQVVIVTHGGAVRAFLLYCRGLDVSQFRQIDKIGNTGLSEVTIFASGGAVIHSVNDLSHLDGLALSGEVVDA